MNVKNESMNEELDIVKEFNTILESVADDSNFNHDRYLRFAFADPKRMAELLKLYARHKPSLREFLDTIDLSTLQGSPENFSTAKHTGSADLVFEANIKTGGKAGLFVGIIAEHKSDVDENVLNQISEYHHHLFAEKKKDVPVVAFIVYNGKDEWNPLSKPHFENYPKYYHKIGYPFMLEFLDVGYGINDDDLKNVSPVTLVALTSLKYIFNEKKFTVSFRKAATHLLKLDRSPEGKEFIRQSLSYFLWRWPNRQEDIKMDRPEIVARRGYETFAEHYVNVGVKRERDENRADTESVLREEGLSEEMIEKIQSKLEALQQSRLSK